MPELTITVSSAKMESIHSIDIRISAVKILYSTDNRQDPCRKPAPIVME